MKARPPTPPRPARASAPRTAAPPPGSVVRAAAARVLEAVLAAGRSSSAVLAEELPAIADARDRALLEAICYEALRRQRRYAGMRQALLERALPASARRIDALLLAGLAQLDGLQMAPYAVISASAEAARLLGQPHLVGLVNAVLRRFDRERAARIVAADAAARLHRDHPQWLRDRLHTDWGAALAERILDAGNAPAPMWLRVNATRCSREAYLQQLADAGIVATAPAQPAQALVLQQPSAPTGLPGWDAGLVSVQDGAAQFAAELLQPRGGQRLLDACAAPGGKAAHLLECAPGASLLAIDSDAARLQRVAATLDRLGLQAQLRCADAQQPDGWWDGRAFDAILIDAPCSGTGVIRRHPDIKWHRRGADIAPLVQQQAALLDAAWPLLAPGGRLLYATCSVLKDENAHQVDAFLARHADARALPLSLPHGRASGGGWQLLPGEGDMDGFFYAALARAPG